MFRSIGHARKLLSSWISGTAEVNQASSSNNKKLKVKADAIIHDVNAEGESKSAPELKEKKLTIIKNPNEMITPSKGYNPSSEKGKGPAKKSKKVSNEQSLKCSQVEMQSNEGSTSGEGGASHMEPKKISVKDEQVIEQEQELSGAQSESTPNMLDQGGPSQEIKQSLENHRQVISQQLGISDTKLESAYIALEEAYQGIRLEEVLGEGKYSKAILFSFGEQEKEEKKVLKLLDAAKVIKDVGDTPVLLTEARMGGEWLALLEFGEGVLRTEKALVCDSNKGKFCLMSAEEVQAMFNNSRLRSGKILVLVGTVSEYIVGSKTLDVFIEERKLSEEKKLKIEEIRNFGRQIFQAITEIQHVSDDEVLIHRDIKPGNIMITKEEKVKIFDFGFSRLISKEKNRYSYIGSEMYAAPEMMKKQEYDEKVDSYSLGVTLFEMVTGSKPFDAFNRKDLDVYIACGQNLENHCAYRLRKVDPDLSDLIWKLGKRNPDERPTVEEALNHPFFTKELSK